MEMTFCTLFNHPFPQNIPILRQLYHSRFADVRFVIPQVRVDSPDVLTVYRGPYNFHGMIVDARSWLSTDSEWYIFAQDDVFLRPDINERNILGLLGLCEQDAFIPSFSRLSWQWPWTFQFLLKRFVPDNTLSGSGIGAQPVSQFIPPSDIAWEKAARFGITKPYYLSQPIDNDPIVKRGAFFGARFNDEAIFSLAIKAFFERLKAEGRLIDDKLDIAYPFVFGMSDFVMVHRSVISEFCNTLGVFAAAQYFVEVAIPTALLVHSKRLGTSRDLKERFDWVWGGARHELTTKSVAKVFEQEEFLVHPVKLGQFLDSPEKKEEFISAIKSRSNKVSD